MKKLLLIIGIISTMRGVSHGDEIHISDLSSGMYSYQDANKIPDTAAHSLKNVYTDIQGMVQQRNGYAGYKTGTANFAVTGMWRFTDTTGTEWLLWFSSRTVYANNGGASNTTVFQSTSDTVPSCTDNLGKFWCTNGSDPLKWWDGVSSATVSSAPAGKLIAAWRQRIALANIPGSQSTIQFSADGDGTSWTLGINPTDPFTRSIGGANSGYAINCMRGSYYDNLIIGRKYDIWYGAGFDGSDLGFRNISNEVGCLESHTMQEFDGSLIFLSWRGIEQMTGSQIQLISEPIRDLVDPIVKNVPNGRSLTLTSAADWNAGTFTGNTVYVDTETVSGNLQTTFPETFSVKRDGISGTKNVWTDINTASSTITNTGSDLSLAVNTKVSGAEILTAERTTELIGALSSGTSFQIKIDQIPSSAGEFSKFTILMTTSPVTKLTSLTGGPFTWAFVWESTTTGQADLGDASSGFNGVSNGVDTASSLTVSTTVSTPFIFNIWIATNVLTYGVNGTQIKSVATTNSILNAKPQYVYLNYANIAAAGTALVDYFSVAPETFTFTSAAQTVSSAISLWDSFNITKVDSAGSVDSAIRSTTTANYTSITSGQTPSISTNTYWQVISTVTYNVVTSTVIPVSIADITQKWVEGSDPPFASAVYDRRYWLSYSENLAATPAANDNTLIYQRNHTWTKFTFGAASFGLWKNNLYFGDSTTGSNVYLFDTGTTDNNAAINAEIETKSFDLGFPAHEKALRNIWIDYFGGSNGSMTVSANTDRTGYTSLGTANLNEGTGAVLAKFPFPLTNGSPERGREIQIKLSKNVIGDKLKLYDVVLELYPKEAR